MADLPLQEGERQFGLSDIREAVDQMVREDDYSPERAQRRIEEILRDCASVEVVPRSEAEALADVLEKFERETWIGDPLSSYLAKVLLEYRTRHPKETP